MHEWYRFSESCFGLVYSKLMSVRPGVGMSHSTVLLGHVMKQQTIVLKKYSTSVMRRLIQLCLEKPQYYVLRITGQDDTP